MERPLTALNTFLYVAQHPRADAFGGSTGSIQRATGVHSHELFTSCHYPADRRLRHEESASRHRARLGNPGTGRDNRGTGTRRAMHRHGAAYAERHRQRDELERGSVPVSL